MARRLPLIEKSAVGQRIALCASKEQEDAFDKSCRDADYNRRRFVSDQPVHPHGLQYQDDSQCGCRGLGLRLGIAGRRSVEWSDELPDWALTVGRQLTPHGRP
jgi:hypothetical protein